MGKSNAVKILRITPDSTAMKIGLPIDGVILHYHELEILNLPQLLAEIEKTAYQTPVQMIVERDG